MSDSRTKTNPIERLKKLQEVARRWQDPDHPARSKAAESEANRSFRLTEEEIAFAINQSMARLLSLERFPPSPVVQKLGVQADGNMPLECLDVFVYAMVHKLPVSCVFRKGTPHVLQAWIDETPADVRSLVAFNTGEEARVDPDCNALLALTSASDEYELVEEHREQNNIPAERCMVITASTGIAIIDGNESADDREGLAEDALLFSGQSRRSVNIIWAQADVEPDAYFEAFAQCRGVYPVHAEIPGTLEMQRAFLEAQDQSHAYAENLAFLISKGEPSVQRPGHIRWVPFEDFDEVSEWLEAHQREVAWVARREQVDEWLAMADQLQLQTGAFGQAHRPAFLEQEGGDALLQMLAARDASNSPIGQS